MWESFPKLKEELDKFEEYLLKCFPTQNGRFENEAARRLFLAGGKRLRPALAISCALPGQYDRPRVFAYAAAVEVLHTATLVHDDIIDEADTRRGMPTVSHAYGASAAVYTGDYLLARSLMLLADSGVEADMSRRVAGAVSAMCSGEIEQYRSRYQIASPETYLKRILRKTALLFAACTAGGAHVASLPEKQQRALARFGIHFGAAFQIRDDLLDLESSAEALGKPAGGDLKEGLATLPLLLSAKRHPEVRQALGSFFGGQLPLADLLALAGQHEYLGDSRAILEKYRLKCRQNLSGLPEGETLSVLHYLTDWL